MNHLHTCAIQGQQGKQYLHDSHRCVQVVQSTDVVSNGTGQVKSVEPLYQKINTAAFGILAPDGTFIPCDSDEHLHIVGKRFLKELPHTSVLWALEDAGYLIRSCNTWNLRYQNRMWLADASFLSVAVMGGFLGATKQKEKVTQAQMDVLIRTIDESDIEWLHEWFVLVEGV